MTLIAVYGTLRQGHGNWDWALNREPLSTEDLPGWTMFGLHGGFPGCVETNNEDDSIVIELYEVNDTELASINRLEGYVEGGNNTFYDRKTIETSRGPAFIYEWMGAHSNPVPHGDWNAYKLERRQHLHAS